MIPERRDLWSPILLAVGGCLVAYGIVRSAGLAWTSDDAFISFRYAENLVEGNGLVFNPGERVEGYTNLLLTLLVAFGMLVGVAPEVSANAIGITAYAAVAFLLLRHGWIRHRTGTPMVPLAAGLWSVQADLQEWATGGLETTLFTALALGGILTLLRDSPTRRSQAGAGVLLALATATRPDGVLFALAGLVIAARAPAAAGQPAGSRLLPFLAPLGACGVALITFKLWYYGQLLPTAFYAKSALDPYWSQGLAYVSLYAIRNWACPVGLLVLLIVSAFERSGIRPFAARRETIALGSTAALFLAYVANSGGDFMHARRLVPAVPFLFLALEGLLVRMPPRAAVAGGTLWIVASLFPAELFSEDPPQRIRGIGHEPSYYPPELVELRRRQGEAAREVFGGMNLRAAFAGGMNIFAYHSRLPYLVEPNGLTQYVIAKRPLARRGPVVGHEKAVGLDWLWEHGVTLIFHQDVPPLPPRPMRYDDLLVHGILRAQLLRYDDVLMRRLATVPAVAFVPIERVLAGAEANASQAGCEAARAIHEELTYYYLDRHPDAGAGLERAVRRACSHTEDAR